MVARAWPVSVEVIQDWLLAAPSQTSPPSCFYDTSILRYPFDLFQWKSMVRVAKVLISWAVLHHRKSMGQLWDAPAPQGCNFYPILRYGLTEPASLFKCGKFHISVKSTL